MKALLLLIITIASSTSYALTGFACTRSSENDGSVCITQKVTGAGFTYSQPIVILVPDGVTSPTGVVLHLQGFRGVCGDDTVNEMISVFGLLDLMKRAKSLNSVVIVPRSAGQDTTLNNELAPHFVAFTTWINTQLSAKNLNYIISGHSGAYQPIGPIVAAQAVAGHVHISHILMLDATYSSLQSYANKWIPAAKANPSLKIYSVTRADTAPGTALIAKTLKPYGISVASQIDTSAHCGIPKKHLGPLLDGIIQQAL